MVSTGAVHEAGASALSDMSRLRNATFLLVRFAET